MLLIFISGTRTLAVRKSTRRCPLRVPSTHARRASGHRGDSRRVRKVVRRFSKTTSPSATVGEEHGDGLPEGWAS